MPDLDTVIATAMRHQRSARSWRQTDLSDRLGWPLSRVNRIEAGHQRIHMCDVLDLCKVFGMPLTDLLTQADPADLQALRLP